MYLYRTLARLLTPTPEQTYFEPSRYLSEETQNYIGIGPNPDLDSPVLPILYTAGFLGICAGLAYFATRSARQAVVVEDSSEYRRPTGLVIDPNQQMFTIEELQRRQARLTEDATKAQTTDGAQASEEIKTIKFANIAGLLRVFLAAGTSADRTAVKSGQTREAQRVYNEIIAKQGWFNAKGEINLTVKDEQVHVVYADNRTRPVSEILALPAIQKDTQKGKNLEGYVGEGIEAQLKEAMSLENVKKARITLR